MAHSANSSPWVNTEATAVFLSYLITPTQPPDLATLLRQSATEQHLAQWLIKNQIGAFAYARCQTTYPSLAQHLKFDTFSAKAETQMHQQHLGKLLTAFANDETRIVLLKGAALALTVYDQFHWRTMSDVDLLINPAQMPHIIETMQALGFILKEDEARPANLQMLSEGELQFYHPTWVYGLVEVHWSAFPGWWLRRVTKVGNEQVWSRCQPIPNSVDPCWQLAPEDSMLHLILHLAINHQLSLSAIRTFVDMALLAEARPINWQLLWERAQAWQVQTAVAYVLHLASQFVPLKGLDTLPPIATWRKTLLSRFVSVDCLLTACDIRKSYARFLLLLLLVDRVSDATKLIYRTIFPEPIWLEARYGKPVSHWYHLRQLLTHGQI